MLCVPFLSVGVVTEGLDISVLILVPRGRDEVLGMSSGGRSEATFSRLSSRDPRLLIASR